MHLNNTLSLILILLLLLRIQSLLFLQQLMFPYLFPAFAAGACEHSFPMLLVV